MNQYVITYHFNGRPYGLTIRAENEAEASRRLRAIGMLVATIPASPVGGILARVICAVRNMARAI